MNYIILNRDELPRDGNTYEFQGYQHGDTNVSFIWVELPPGGGPRLHKHPKALILEAVALNMSKANKPL